MDNVSSSDVKIVTILVKMAIFIIYSSTLYKDKENSIWNIDRMMGKYNLKVIKYFLLNNNVSKRYILSGSVKEEIPR